MEPRRESAVAGGGPSAALLLVDRLFEQRVNQEKTQKHHQEDELTQRQEEPPHDTEAAARTAPRVPQDWGEADALIDAFVCREEERDFVVDLNLLPEDISAEELQKLTGRVCRYRCMIHQPLNAEHYVGAVDFTHKDGSRRWRTAKYRDWLPVLEEREEHETEGEKLQETQQETETEGIQSEEDPPAREEKSSNESRKKETAEEEAADQEKKTKGDSREQQEETGRHERDTLQQEEEVKKKKAEEKDGKPEKCRGAAGAAGGSLLRFEEEGKEEGHHAGIKEKQQVEKDALETKLEDGWFAREGEQVLQREPLAESSRFYSSDTSAVHAGSDPTPACFYLRKGEFISSGDLQESEEKRQFEEPQQQLWSRWPYRCIAVPGETAWCRETAAAGRHRATATAEGTAATPADELSAATENFSSSSRRGTPTFFSSAGCPGEKTGRHASSSSNSRGLLGCTVVLYAQPQQDGAATCSSSSRRSAEESTSGKASQQEKKKNEKEASVSSSSSNFTPLLLNDVVEVYGIFSASLLRLRGLPAAAFATSLPPADGSSRCLSGKAAAAGNLSRAARACVCGQSSASFSSAGRGLRQSAHGVTSSPAVPHFLSHAVGYGPALASPLSEELADASSAALGPSPPPTEVAAPSSPAAVTSPSGGCPSPHATAAVSLGVSRASAADVHGTISMWDLRLHAFYVRKLRNFNPAVELAQQRAAKAATLLLQQQAQQVKTDTATRRSSCCCSVQERRTAEADGNEEYGEGRRAAAVEALPPVTCMRRREKQQQHGLDGERETPLLQQQQQEEGETTATLCEKGEEDATVCDQQRGRQEGDTHQEEGGEKKSCCDAGWPQQQQRRSAEDAQQQEEAAPAAKPQQQIARESPSGEQQGREARAGNDSCQQLRQEANVEDLQQQTKREQEQQRREGEVEETRQTLLQFLTRAACGDAVAAEYLLLALCSRRVVLEGEENDLLHATLRLNLVMPEEQQQQQRSGTGRGELRAALTGKEVGGKAEENSVVEDAGDRPAVGRKNGEEGIEGEEGRGGSQRFLAEKGREEKQNVGTPRRPTTPQEVVASPLECQGETRRKEASGSNQQQQQQQRGSQQGHQDEEGEKARRSCCCCCCSRLSDSSWGLLTALQTLVPRLRGFALLPEVLFERRLTCRLLPGIENEEEEEEEGELTRGVLQMARGTVLLVEEPQKCTRSLLAAASRRHALEEKENEDAEEDKEDKGESPAQRGSKKGSEGSWCGEPISSKTSSREKDEKEARGRSGTARMREEGRRKTGNTQQEEVIQCRIAQLQSAAREELRALDLLFSDAVVPVSYGYVETRVPTDVPIICVSFGEASLFADYSLVLPVPCLRQSDADTSLEGTTATASVAAAAGEAETSLSWQCLIGHASCRNTGVCIHPPVRAIIIQDWVQMRQSDASIKSDDLSRWLILADAMAASYGEGVNGEGVLKVEHWKKVLKLETERRERIKRAFS